MSLTIASSPAPPQVGYFRRQLPVFIILGTFLALTLPLCLLSLTDPSLLERYYVKPIFIWTLGSTHFVITLTIYLQSRNLHYFNSSWQNRLLYFAIPLAIFVLFDCYSALQLAVIAPAFDGIFRAGIRFMDNHHVTRQSFGVTQLFMKRSGLACPPWLRPTQDAFFHLMTGMLLLTYFSGGTFNPANWLMLLCAAIAAALCIVVVAGFVMTSRHSGQRGAMMAPVAYFLMQSVSAALGVYQTSLYVYCLAMHYVEYHVLMMPRCFDIPLDPSTRTDRLFDRLRANRTVFYGLILVIAGLATYMSWITMGWLMHKSWGQWPAPYRFLLAMFDGLFVFHYFIESLIWKFGNPFYRSALGPLYFATGEQSRSPQGT